MSDQHITFVNSVIVPWGLIAIMFSLGLSLALSDFAAIARNKRSVAAGLFGQLLVLPFLGWGIVFLFKLPPEMAVGLLVLAASPGGVTSNAVVFAARGNVALSVVLTLMASLITVVTTPFLVKFAITSLLTEGNAPEFSVLATISRLFQITVIPVTTGIVIKRLFPEFADRLVIWLRPASVIVLVSVIGFSVFISAELVFANLLVAGPAALALNISAIMASLVIARLAQLNRSDAMTISVEIGVQNATVATFLTLSVLNELALAITPTIYGVIMLVNAFLFVRISRVVQARKEAASDSSG